MEWYSKESVWYPNMGEAPLEKSLSSLANTEVSNSKSSSCSGASKRKRGYYKSPEKVRCSVDGCTFDLRNCREYHRRHRVCQPHSKTSSVLVKGQEQRFCQQCSRFQSLDEFDGFKRSCRRRLEGHNKRRRKPPPPPLGFSADYTGPRILKFGNPTTHDPYLSMWASKPGSYNRYPPILPKMEQQSLVGRPFANLENMQEKQVSGNEGRGCGMSLYMYNQSVSELAEGVGNGNSSQKVPSDSALYLLSAQNCSEFSMVESAMDCPIQSQPPLERVQFDDGTQKCSCSRSVTSGPKLALDANALEFHHNGMLQVQMGSEPLENGGSSLTLPFFWE